MKTTKQGMNESRFKIDLFHKHREKCQKKKQFDVCEIDMNTQTFSFKKQISTICQNFTKKMKSDSNGINEIKTEVMSVARYSMRFDVLLI